MKLVTYSLSGIPRLGTVFDDWVIDLARAYPAFRGIEGRVGRAGTDFPSDMLSFLRRGGEVWQVARQITDWVKSADLDSENASFVHPLSGVRLLPPVPDPGKIICVGLNYADHCREQNLEKPTSPVLFAKFPSSLIGPEETISWPPGSTEKVDYEAELAVVIGGVAGHVPAESAYEYVAGYTIVNDVSARDVQFADKQWVRGKSFDTFCPMGPYLVTPDEVGDPHRLAIRCRLNGQLMQDSSTAEMIFRIPELIEFISRTSTLLPGDIISTGTPDGVGVFRDPQVFLKAGDMVEVEVEKLGSLRNPVGQGLPSSR